MSPVELVAAVWDWLKDNAAYTTLFLVGMVCGLWLGAFIAYLADRRGGGR